MNCNEDNKPLVTIVAMAKIPQCPHCKGFCSPAGGMLDGSELFWMCYDCNYQITDVIATEVIPLKLNK